MAGGGGGGEAALRRHGSLWSGGPAAAAALLPSGEGSCEVGCEGVSRMRLPSSSSCGDPSEERRAEKGARTWLTLAITEGRDEPRERRSGAGPRAACSRSMTMNCTASPRRGQAYRMAAACTPHGQPERKYARASWWHGLSGEGSSISDAETIPSAQSLAGSPISSVACSSCAAYHEHRKSDRPPGPYWPTLASGCAQRSHGFSVEMCSASASFSRRNTPVKPVVSTISKG
mmetsp:Transcript_36480/g.122149  ORF Transcript_36480/g.122149 Transcript_36480/m.122149 type:complete len:231 (+) Transcript_36480:142-834(+)